MECAVGLFNMLSHVKIQSSKRLVKECNFSPQDKKYMQCITNISSLSVVLPSGGSFSFFFFFIVLIVLRAFIRTFLLHSFRQFLLLLFLIQQKNYLKIFSDKYQFLAIYLKSININLLNLYSSRYYIKYL